MKVEDIKRVLIIGGGTMGQQIALQFALHGCDVVIYDIKTEILEMARVRMGKLVQVVALNQSIPPEQAVGVMDRITMTTIPEEAAVGIDLVSESVPEDPGLKGKVFAIFNRLCPPQAIFTTNMSTLLPSMIAEATGRPEKFLAFHFHDVRVSTIVDIMPHPGTAAATIDIVKAFAERMGLIPIILKKESFGYVFNAMLMTLCQSAQTLASNDIASVEDIDRAWMGVTGMFIGPFGIMDSVGIDTVWHITDFWAKKTGDPQSLKNAGFLKHYVDQGKLGQKSGAGFYSYPKPLFTQPGFIRGHLLGLTPSSEQGNKISIGEL